MTVFAIQTVSSVGPAAIRVVFSAAAQAVSDVNSNDALNPVNYQLSGPGSSRIIRVVAVPDDPRAFTLFASNLLAAGSWSLLTSGVTAVTGEALDASSRVAIFSVVSTQPQDLRNGGAEDVTPETVLRQFLSPAFVGEGWDALVYALSRGDQHLQDTARGAWDQMFLSTAEGKYLDRLARELGVTRPAAVGMRDDVFRELAIRLSSDRITYKAIWEILEVFYGSSAVRAVIQTQVDAPYALSDQMQLQIDIDGTIYPIVFSTADFAIIGQAQAIEVAASISRQLRQLGSRAWAATNLNPDTGLYRVSIYSPTLGLASKIRVVGGLAQYPLRFPELVANVVAGSTYAISLPGNDKAAVAITTSTPAMNVRVGDYLLARDSDLNVANRGTFEITDVTVTWTGSAYLQTLTIVNPVAVTQAGPLSVAANDLQVYRATYTAPSSNGAMVSGVGNAIRLHLPTTTKVVTREAYKAAYVPAQTTSALGDLSATLGPNGSLTVTTGVAHGLQANDFVTLDNVRPTSYTHPLTTVPIDGAAGATGTTGASRQSFVSFVRSLDSFVARTGAAGVALNNGDIFIHGGRTTATYYSTYKVMRFLGTTLDAASRPVYSYNHYSTADTGYAAAYSGASSYRGSLGIGAFIVCGQTANTPTFTQNARLFLSATGGANVGSFLTVANTTHPACRFPLALTILDASQRQQVLIIGGQDTVSSRTNVISVFNPAVNGLAVAAASTVGLSNTDTDARSEHAGCALSAIDDATKPVAALWCGGFGTTPLDSTNFASNLITPTWTTPGRMAVARFRHRVVDIGGGRALAIGGFGRVLANETVSRLVDEVEMFDVATGAWTPAGRLRYGRYNPVVFRIGTKVYVIGGMRQAGSFATSSIFPTEVYDIPTGKWSLAPFSNAEGFATAGFAYDYGVAVVSGGVGFFFGGEDATTGNSSLTSTSFTPQTVTAVFVPGSDYAAPAHRVNGVHRVTSVPSSTSFTISGLETGDVLRSEMAPGATITLNKTTTASAQARAIGPYVWDDKASPLLTSTESTITTAISKNAQIGVLALANAASFPDAPGWLAIRVGYEDAAYPIPYLRRISNTELAIDNRYIWPYAYAVGAKVTLLSQQSPGFPENAQTRGSFYVTNSNAGRVAAESAVRSAVAAGPGLNVKVLYPDDVGLGNAGYPMAGSQKLSDAVRVWGGDGLTAEVAAAQEEDDIT
jgi:hypothetical protein